MFDESGYKVEKITLLKGSDGSTKDLTHENLEEALKNYTLDHLSQLDDSRLGSTVITNYKGKDRSHLIVVQVKRPDNNLPNVEMIPTVDIDIDHFELLGFSYYAGDNPKKFVETNEEAELRKYTLGFGMVPPRYCKYNKETGVLLVEWYHPSNNFRTTAQYKINL